MTFLDTVIAVNPFIGSKDAGKKATINVKWATIASRMADSTSKLGAHAIISTGDNMRMKFKRMHGTHTPTADAHGSGTTGASLSEATKEEMEKFRSCLELKKSAEQTRHQIQVVAGFYQQLRDDNITQATREAAAGNEPMQRDLFKQLDRKDKALRARLAVLQSSGAPAIPSADEARLVTMYEDMVREHPGWKEEYAALPSRAGAGRGAGRLGDQLKQTLEQTGTYLQNVRSDTDPEWKTFLTMATASLGALQRGAAVAAPGVSMSPAAAASAAPTSPPPKRMSQSERLHAVKRRLEDKLIDQEAHDKAVHAILLDPFE